MAGGSPKSLSNGGHLTHRTPVSSFAGRREKKNTKREEPHIHTDTETQTYTGSSLSLSLREREEDKKETGQDRSAYRPTYREAPVESKRMLCAVEDRGEGEGREGQGEGGGSNAHRRHPRWPFADEESPPTRLTPRYPSTPSSPSSLTKTPSRASEPRQSAALSEVGC